jgi:hypothetical protein
MDTENSFPLSLDFEGKHYAGTITPSDEKGSNGVPVYFRVTFGDALFAYICCSDNGWMDRDGNNNHKGLINAIGAYIADYYE